MRHMILAALLAATAPAAFAAPVPKEQLLVPPKDATHYVVVSEAGKHGDMWRWTLPDGRPLWSQPLDMILGAGTTGIVGANGVGKSVFLQLLLGRLHPTVGTVLRSARLHAVAQEVLAWLKERDPKSGPDILPIAVDAAGWHRIDKHEVATGSQQGRPRVKLTDWQTLLDVAQGG